MRTAVVSSANDSLVREAAALAATKPERSSRRVSGTRGLYTRKFPTFARAGSRQNVSGCLVRANTGHPGYLKFCQARTTGRSCARCEPGSIMAAGACLGDATKPGADDRQLQVHPLAAVSAGHSEGVQLHRVAGRDVRGSGVLRAAVLPEALPAGRGIYSGGGGGSRPVLPAAFRPGRLFQPPRPAGAAPG